MMYLTIITIAFITVLTRFLPFFIFRNKIPKLISTLGYILPSSLIAMIFVYSCKDIIQSLMDTETIFYGIYGIIGILSVIFLHLVFKKILISIIGGTLFYIILCNYELIIQSI